MLARRLTIVSLITILFGMIFAMIVAEAGRDGGEVTLHRLSRSQPVARVRVEGDTEFLTKVGSEDDFLANGRYQHHTEEVWKRNEGQIAAADREKGYRIIEPVQREAYATGANLSGANAINMGGAAAAVGGIQIAANQSGAFALIATNVSAGTEAFTLYRISS